MWNHYQKVALVQNAIIANDLDAARMAARSLADHQDAEGLPAVALPYVDSMRAAASVVADASDLTVAATATAKMGAVCGSCHVAAQNGPTFPVINPIPARADSTLADRMTMHVRAVNQMWNGLTGPSSASWDNGAAALARPAGWQAMVHRTNRNRAFADSMAQHVQALGSRAPLAAPMNRADVYGDMLATCAACHEAYRVRLPTQGGLSTN